jgi:hypothetical protein
MDKTTLILGGLGVGGLLWWLSRQQQTGIPAPVEGSYFPIEGGVDAAPSDGGFGVSPGMVIRQPAQEPAPPAPMTVSISDASAALSKRAPTITTGGLDPASASKVSTPTIMAPVADRAAFAIWLGNREGRAYPSPNTLVTTAAMLDLFNRSRSRVEALARAGKLASSSNLNAAIARWWYRVDPEGFAAWDRRVCPSVPGSRRTPDDVSVLSTIPSRFSAVKAAMARGLAQAKALDAAMTAQEQAQAEYERAQRFASVARWELLLFGLPFVVPPPPAPARLATGTQGFVTPDTYNPPSAALNQILGRDLVLAGTLPPGISLTTLKL